MTKIAKLVTLGILLSTFTGITGCGGETQENSVLPAPETTPQSFEERAKLEAEEAAADAAAYNS